MQNTLIIIPPDPAGNEYTREMRCQEKREVLGTLKPPLTPALMCSLFREQGIPFKIMESLSASQAASRLEQQKFKPDLILFPTCTPTVQRDLAFIKKLKNKTGANTAAFGPHTSGIPKETLEQFSALDFAIIGEPEHTALDLARNKDPEQIPGLAWRREQGDIAVNDLRSNFPAMDEMPFPDWEPFKLSRYRVPMYGKRFLLVELSRGCPYHCDFCVVPLTHTGKVREKSAERTIEEIRYMKNKYGTSFFYFWGDTAVYNPRTMKRIADLIIEQKLNIQWISNTRPEAIQDIEYAKTLNRSGCQVLSMGAESGDPETLERMGKNLNLATLKRAVDTLADAGIQSFLFFMFGYPGENMASLKKTRDLALRLNPDYANFYPVVPYPGTPLWTHCEENGMLQNKNWSQIDFTHYTLRQPGLSHEQVMRFVRRARMDFYLRPTYIMRTLQRIGTPRRALHIIKSIPAYFDL